MNWLRRLLDRWRLNRALRSDDIVEIASDGRVLPRKGLRGTALLRDSREEY